ncbi:MAG: hypothetical protein C0596_09015 [Marinilabiliales bacterium]|nr:MAG: hypothetical protein C0596_09015 [Marinilabiliales bacterium]
MKKLLIITLTAFSIISCSQTAETTETTEENSQTEEPQETQSNFVSFETTIDISNATKDGIYCEDYVVNLEYDEIEKLDGKKVKISGDVTTVKGLEKEYDENGEEIIMQGRSGDTWHILEPTIEVLEE